MRLVWTTLLAIALYGCAATPAETARADARHAVEQQKLAKTLSGFTRGKTSDCLDEFSRSDASTEAFGPTILYRVGRNRIYRSDTSGGCENLQRGDILITRTFSSQLCRGDIATTVDQSTRSFSGTCSFGDFTRYQR